MPGLQRAREIRDIQYEMSQIEVKLQKDRLQRKINTQDMTEGITRFENNLIRIGIGGNIDGAIKSGSKAMVEDPVIFQQRLQSKLEAVKPSEKEIQSITKELKERVVSNRNARQDRIKRKKGSDVL